jgi:hypothetical protein
MIVVLAAGRRAEGEEPQTETKGRDGNTVEFKGPSV